MLPNQASRESTLRNLGWSAGGGLENYRGNAILCAKTTSKLVLPNSDFLRADLQDPIIALAGIANVYDDSPTAEVPLLRKMEMTAEMDPRRYDVKCIEKTSLAASRAAGKAIRETDGASVGEQDIHAPAGDQGHLMGDILVGDVVGLSVGLGPYAAYSGEPQAAYLPNLPRGQKHRTAVRVPGSREDFKIVMIAIDREDARLCNDALQVGRIHLARVTPIPARQDQIGLGEVQCFTSAAQITMHIADGGDSHLATHDI